jgi:transcriptional regulator with XRE-family HTH domain
MEMHSRFRDRLHEELRQRRSANPRYSLRAFAAFLGADHSTVSQVLRGKRPVPASRIRAWAKKLGIHSEEAAAYIAAEHLADPQTVLRDNQLRHWTAEALAIITRREHWMILELSRTPGFVPNCGQIARHLGITVDDVNIALNRLLRLRLLETNEHGVWIDASHPAVASEREFRTLALARIREQSAALRRTA